MRRVTWKYAAALIACLAFTIICIEIRTPYYFFQDDNRNYALPLLVHCYRTITGGEFPLFNFHQYAGSPVLSGGAAAALYPFGYFALAVSRAFWGHDFAAIDLLVGFHLMLGALGLFSLIKLWTGNVRAAAWAGLTGVLATFVIYVSACWLPFSGLVAYFPWMVYFGLRLVRRPGIRPFAGLVISRLLLFYIGYPQGFLYAALFECFLVAGAVCLRPEASRDRVWPSLRTYIGTWLVVLVLSAPLLLPMAYQTTISAERQQPLSWLAFLYGGYTPAIWLLGLLNPFSSAHYNSLPIAAFLGRSMPYFAHVGYATLPLLACGFYAFFREGAANRRRRYFFLLFYAAAISFAWSVDALAPIMYHVPILNRFRWPFKLQLFTSLFLVSMAAIGLSWLLRSIRSPRIASLVFGLAMALTVGESLFLYTAIPARTFRTMQEKPPLQEPLKDRLREGRVLSVGYRFEDQDDADSTGFAYASLWGLNQLSGYDPLIPAANRKVAALTDNFTASFSAPPEELSPERMRRWAVKWYVVASYASQYLPVLERAGMVPFYRDGKRTIYLDPHAPPLVYWEEGGAAGPTPHFTSNTIALAVDEPADRRLHLVFVSNPFFRARIDGRGVAISQTADGQMSIRVPAGKHRIAVEYRDPYFLAGCWIFVAGLAAILVWAFAAVRFRRKPTRERRELARPAEFSAAHEVL